MSKYPTHSVLQAFGNLEMAITDKIRASSANNTSPRRKAHVHKLVVKCHQKQLWWKIIKLFFPWQRMHAPQFSKKEKSNTVN